MEAGVGAARAVASTTPGSSSPYEESDEGPHQLKQEVTQGLAEPEALPPAATCIAVEEPANDAPTAQAGGGSFLQRLIGAPPSIHAAILSQDGSVLYTGTDAAAPPQLAPARAKPLHARGRVCSPPSNHQNPQSPGALSAVSRAGSRGPSERDITVWSVGSGRLLRTLKGHSSPVLCLCLSPDGGSLYSGSYDKTIRCFPL